MPSLQFKGKSVIETYHHTVPHHRLKRDKRMLYCEKIWIHQDELAVFQRDHNKRIRLMQAPFQLK